MSPSVRVSRRRALGFGAGALAVGLVWLVILWARSLVPGTYSVMEMGVVDLGGAPGTQGVHDPGGHGHHGGPAVAAGAVNASTTSVTELTGPREGRPDVSVEVVARQETFRLADGREVEGFTLNGSSPGPLIEARQGDLVQVDLVNDSVAEGVTLHWHGVDVPNAEDGVAGVTQDAVAVGQRHTYRFRVDDAGTYWYHAHHVAHRQVVAGLFGVLVVHPVDPDPVDLALVAAVHAYDGVPTVNGMPGQTRVAAEPGASVRARVVNTDNGPLDVAVSGSVFRVLAIDGTDVVGPTDVRHRTLRVPAGGRADVGLTIPTDGSAVLVQLGAGGTPSIVLGPTDAAVPEAAPTEGVVDLLSYGRAASLDFDPERPDRRFAYTIDRRPGFVDGVPGLHWTINGRHFPDVPMFVVARGDVVRMTLTNNSGQLHPMHLHGHHAVVLSRDGVPASGSPWWIDSLDVPDGATFDIAFLAVNPGIWMDHCHNLRHAREGLVAHLMYEGVTTPYLVGGPAGNAPE